MASTVETQSPFDGESFSLRRPNHPSNPNPLKGLPNDQVSAVLLHRRLGLLLGNRFPLYRAPSRAVAGISIAAPKRPADALSFIPRAQVVFLLKRGADDTRRSFPVSPIIPRDCKADNTSGAIFVPRKNTDGISALHQRHDSSLG